MRRLYEELMKEHLYQNEQMFFLVGPRRVGKTTTSRMSDVVSTSMYLNWDDRTDHDTIKRGYVAIVSKFNLEKGGEKPLVIFAD